MTKPLNVKKRVIPRSDVPNREAIHGGTVSTLYGEHQKKKWFVTTSKAAIPRSPVSESIAVRRDIPRTLGAYNSCFNGASATNFPIKLAIESMKKVA